jgi:hypothetical protein
LNQINAIILTSISVLILHFDYIKNMVFNSIVETNINKRTWAKPISRNFGELSDPILYSEVLDITLREGKISLRKLTSETEGLRQRLRRLWIVDKPTKTKTEGLLKAMTEFGWLREDENGFYQLTDEGLNVHDLSKDEKTFRRILINKMHKRYVIPGWFLSRLYQLNPLGQGEIVLPSPLKNWQPKSKQNDNKEWSDELTEQVINSAKNAKKLFHGSFPIDNSRWVEQVMKRWEKYILKEKNSSSKIRYSKSGKVVKPYYGNLGARERLTLAMREAAIDYFFSAYVPVLPNEKYFRELEFDSSKHPIPPRSFRDWCPKLEALELIFYTDFHPLISGRLLFPCGIFRTKAINPPFETIRNVIDPNGNILYLYQPRWEDIKEQFVITLVDTHKRISNKAGALYISLLDVRDEVCRQLRLSSIIFDNMIENAYSESIKETGTLKNILISLESDIRAEQSSGWGLSRRPVYVNKIPHSLISIYIKKRR